MSRKHLLLIAFHFPPLQGGSGLHRTLSLVRYLPRSTWKISVITASRSAYRNVRDENISLVPDHIHIIRAPALDTSRHLSFRGRYPGVLALPDQFQSWIALASIAGLVHCIRNRPDIILSTYPVASAHVIGSILHRATHAPWVTDFRDPMAQDDYPADARRRNLLHKLERHCVESSARVLVTTPGTRRLYLERYPKIPNENFCLIPNGYDEAMFSNLSSTRGVDRRDRIFLLHSGVLGRTERDPTCFFEALSQLKKENPSISDRIRVMFRGTNNPEHFESIAQQLGVDSMISFGGAISYQAAIEEMSRASALLIFQASNCNNQIPAKIYEYLRSGRPIIAFTDPSGDTARLLASCGIDHVADLQNKESIKQLLKGFFCGNRQGFSAGENFDVSQYSRQRIAIQVSELLTQLCT